MTSPSKVQSEKGVVEVEGSLVALENGKTREKVMPVVAVAAPPTRWFAWGGATAFLFVGGLALGIVLGSGTGSGSSNGGGGGGGDDAGPAPAEAAASSDRAERGMAYFTASIEVESFASCDALLSSRTERSADYACPLPSDVSSNAPRVVSEVRGGTCQGAWRPQYRAFSVDSASSSYDDDGGSVAEVADASRDGGDEDGGGGDADFSSTNNQEEGVDEADWVKATGDGYLFVAGKVRGGERDENGALYECGYQLTVVEDDADGGLAVVAALDLAPLVTTPKAMFVEGDVLLLYGTAELAYEDERGASRNWWCGSNTETATIALTVDVSDRANPVVVRRQIFEGRYVSARKIGSVAYLVVAKSSWYAVPRASVPFFRDERWTEGGFSVVADSTYAAAAGAAGDAHPVCDCSGVKYVKAMDRDLDDFTIVVAISMGDDAATADSPTTTIAARAADSAVYASKRNLYLTQTEWTYGGDDDDDDGDDGGSETYYRTVVVKLALDGMAVTYETSFAAPGRLLNQFSLSESSVDGTFRLATTARSPSGGWADTSNSVYVFDAGGARVGALTGLAPGESIMSCRFTATRAYLVTFVRTDPLFVISLDDPTDPRVLGELKIPGYSAYLHPINATHVIGVGRDADEDGNEKGLQFSVFDVSDELNPRQVAVEILGDRGSSSEALYEHKAFQLWTAPDLASDGVDKTRGLFAVPAEIASLARTAEMYPDDDYYTNSRWASGLAVFQGLVLYDETLSPAGNVTHHGPGFYDYEEANGYARTYKNSRESGAHVTRSLRRGDALYTFSDNAVRKTSLDGRGLIGEADLAAAFNFSALTDDDGYGGYYGFYGYGGPRIDFMMADD